ncbi:PVC-type heme-binding CxxCH protein [Planctomicrobium sp. SH661]|uniref:PVC-type heme-binding CxxCH protein n=1 Tax=Planctomicrobium sp. SH661 TaxID=3448124 RepID=UPI003F5BB3D9
MKILLARPLLQKDVNMQLTRIMNSSLLCRLTFCMALLCTLPAAAQFEDRTADPDLLPSVPPGFKITMFAREPLIRQPCSMAFDTHGRLFIGMGPQYRNPTPETPGDSVVLVTDQDGDGIAETTKTFATGFNAIQGLAWHGKDLWVANAPDFTIVRDLDGDDEADEYVLVYTDLGNLEHGLHGLNWAPDGKLYMSKGNSKGLTLPDWVAPKPFRDLWGVSAPPGTPDIPLPKTFSAKTYRRAYHDPVDDWGVCGGILRCDDGGANLEVVSRGLRNPWDITFDSGFQMLGTDNDQTQGDRVFMPFEGADFGWNHPWSAHWSHQFNAPTAPVSGPLFEGSGTGIVYGRSKAFPPEYRNLFFINDWLRKTTFVWRPHWDGGMMRPEKGDWQPFVEGGASLFRPTDMEFGPDGALWILGWSRGYGAEYENGQIISEGRIFRVTWENGTQQAVPARPAHSDLSGWSVAELINELDELLPVRVIDAQDELVRRGPSLVPELFETLKQGSFSQHQETWTVWVLGRLMPSARESITRNLLTFLEPASTSSLNLKLQAVRILGRDLKSDPSRPIPDVITEQLHSPEPRLRSAAVISLAQSGRADAVALLVDHLGTETDPVTYYSAWRGLVTLSSPALLKSLLHDDRDRVRRGALLALLETHALTRPEVASLQSDPAVDVREIVESWLEKSAADVAPMLAGKPLSTANTTAGAVPCALNLHVRGNEAGYRVVAGGLAPGSQIYCDRNYTFTQIPQPLLGADFIQTFNEDDASSGEDFLSFDSPLPLRVWVAFDRRLPSLPTWAHSFTPSSLSIGADHWEFQLVTREFPPGRIELGGNTDNAVPGGKSQYIVVLEPLPLSQQLQPATIDSALKDLANADPARGEILFKHRGGAGCFKCHSLDTTRNGFGPNLADLGRRADPKHIVQSMIDPSAVITEGFTLQQIVMDDGRIYSGVLLEESGLFVSLGLTTGEAVKLRKQEIETRQSARISAMPSQAQLLTSQQIADLTAFLLTQKSGLSASTSSSTPEGFRFERTSDRVRVLLADQEVAEYVYADPRILRPHLANIRTGNGTRITRPNPPVPDVDAIDHDTMHPGIWLAFGDLNGEDFWRNQARIQHLQFIEEPRDVNGNLTWTTESQLLSSRQQPLGRLLNRLTFSRRPHGWRAIWDASIVADGGEIRLGDQEEMGFGVRLSGPLTELQGGTLLDSRQKRTAENIWGEPAEWCDASEVMEGRPYGIAVMSSPSNFRPAWWHVRNYGLIVANPFGRAAMQQGEPSKVTVSPGKALRLVFAVEIHEGGEFDAASACQDFIQDVERQSASPQ